MEELREIATAHGCRWPQRQYYMTIDECIIPNLLRDLSALFKISSLIVRHDGYITIELVNMRTRIHVVNSVGNIFSPEFNYIKYVKICKSLNETFFHGGKIKYLEFNTIISIDNRIRIYNQFDEVMYINVNDVYDIGDMPFPRIHVEYDYGAEYTAIPSQTIRIKYGYRDTPYANNAKYKCHNTENFVCYSDKQIDDIETSDITAITIWEADANFDAKKLFRNPHIRKITIGNFSGLNYNMQDLENNFNIMSFWDKSISDDLALEIEDILVRNRRSANTKSASKI